MLTAYPECIGHVGIPAPGVFIKTRVQETVYLIFCKRNISYGPGACRFCKNIACGIVR